MQKVIQTGRKHCGKRINCSLWTISPFSPKCFQKVCFPGTSKGVIVWKWVKAPFTEIFTFAASVDQDQAAQNLQTDLQSSLSAVLEHYKQKIARNLPLSLAYYRIKMFIAIYSAL